MNPFSCATCDHWVTVHRTIYGNGSDVVTWRSTDGKGRCRVLKIDTDPDFGCIQFQPSVGTHAEITLKSGEPWQHHVDIPCPDCNGAGCMPGTDTINKWACHRCCGTGRVRKYDDGYIGEEKTRMHPKEKELRAKGEPLPGTTLAPIAKPDATDTGGIIS